MLRIVARNGRSLSKIRIMPSAIVSNRMVYTGIINAYLKALSLGEIEK